MMGEEDGYNPKGLEVKVGEGCRGDLSGGGISGRGL